MKAMKEVLLKACKALLKRWLALGITPLPTTRGQLMEDTMEWIRGCKKNRPVFLTKPEWKNKRKVLIAKEEDL